MEILWLGHSSFRIRAREATVITDPCPPSTGYTIGKPTADIVTLSHAHDDHTYLKAVAGKPTVLDGPGEYEISGAFVTAIPTYHDGEKGGERGKNLTFVIEMEGIKICHLGDLGHAPTADQAEGMTGADVLMIPVGGDSTIDGAEAAESAVQEFDRVFKEGGLPDDVPEVEIPSEELRDGAILLPNAMAQAGLCSSTSEARRLIQGGGVKLDGEKVDDPKSALTAGSYLVQAGKRKVARVKVP